MHQLGCKIKKLVTGMLSVFLAVIVPEYVKKIIFVVTVDAILFDVKKDDYSRLAEINKQYHLLSESHALAFPASLTKFVWDQTMVSELLKEAILVKKQELDPVVYNSSLKDVAARDAMPAIHLATKLALKAPYWLRYGKTEQRSSDIVFSTREKMNELSAA